MLTGVYNATCDAEPRCNEEGKESISIEEISFRALDVPKESHDQRPDEGLGHEVPRNQTIPPHAI